MTVNELVVTVTDVLQQFLRECAEAGVYQSTEELILATATALVCMELAWYGEKSLTFLMTCSARHQSSDR